MKRKRRPSTRSGFTVVELLVLVGVSVICAFFIWYALAPLPHGLAKAAQSAGVQTSRTIAIAEFQYAGDHNNNYPDCSGGSAQDIARILMGSGGGEVYISDPSIFYIPKSREKKYGGWWAPPPTTGLRQANVSYDFAGNSGSGLNPDTSDLMPVVWSSVGAAHAPNLKDTGPVAVTLTSDMPYGTVGIAVVYKSNSAKFVNQPAGAPNLCPPEFIGTNTATVLSGGG